METMNKAFYLRMIKSSKRLVEPKNSHDERGPYDRKFESQTPSHVSYVNKVTDRDDYVIEETSSNRRSRLMQKTKSIHTKTLKSLLYSSFDNRTTTNKLVVNQKATSKNAPKAIESKKSKCGSITFRCDPVNTVLKYHKSKRWVKENEDFGTSASLYYEKGSEKKSMK